MIMSFPNRASRDSGLDENQSQRTAFSRTHNMLARIASESTRTYYIMMRCLLPLKRKITGKE